MLDHPNSFLHSEHLDIRNNLSTAVAVQSWDILAEGVFTAPQGFPWPWGQLVSNMHCQFPLPDVPPFGGVSLVAKTCTAKLVSSHLLTTAVHGSERHLEHLHTTVQGCFLSCFLELYRFELN